jgi:hypothetical protein
MRTLLVLVFTALCGTRLVAAMENGVVIAVQVKGTVEVVRAKGAAPVAVANNDALNQGDTIETKAQSSCVLVLPNGSTVSVRERTRLAISLALQDSYTDAELVAANAAKREPSKSSTSLDLLLGEIVVQAKKLLGGSDLSVKTPAGTAKVKGTEFEVAYAEDATGGDYNLSTASGHVVFAQGDGVERDVPANQQLKARARRDKAGGVKLERVNSGSLPAERKRRIQGDIQAASRESAPALQRMKTLRDERRRQPQTDAQRQTVPTVQREQRGRVVDTPAQQPDTSSPVPAGQTTRAKKPAAKPTAPEKPAKRPAPPRPGG